MTKKESPENIFAEFMKILDTQKREIEKITKPILEGQKKAQEMAKPMVEYQQKLFMELRLRTADLYRKINEAVEAYSQANGIALVFVADNPSVEGARTQEQLQAMVTVRKLLYAHPSFDITKAILTSMNTAYQLAPRSKPASTRP